jgi:hypothetical protein|tara:strand:+ start:85 stop:780 length:696 start_codon:yes stop_codon:yes gene_type:complete
MSPCLVQQLFRQKVGEELDQGIVDEVLFPMLRSMKHGPKELLQDIKLTSGTLTTGIHVLTGEGNRHPVGGRCNIPPFTPIPEYWENARPPLFREPHPPLGRRASNVRRKNIRGYNWGTIDILNELRGLNYPQMGYGPTCFEDKSETPESPEDEFDDAYIRLEEDNSLPPDYWPGAKRSQNRVAIEGRSRFVNNLLDNALVTGKCLAWEGGVLGWDLCKKALVPPFRFRHRQ